MNEYNEEKSRLQATVERLKAHFAERSPTFAPDKRDELESALSELTDSLQSLDREREAARLLSHRLEQTHEELPSNVLPLRRSRPLQAFSKVDDRRWILRIDCLIESPHISEIHKMALELHGHSRRYAFIEFRDLLKETRSDADELLKLGGVSLFIPSILDLTAHEQLALLTICRLDTLHRPLLMVGSELTYAELNGEPNVNADLLACLTRAYIKLTRPFREYKEQGLIQYFLDSLSTSPT